MTICFDQLRDVNSEVNQLPYVFKREELWKKTKDYAACSNSTSIKYQALYDLGWPTNFLREATCWVEAFKTIDKITGELRWATEDERYHAVLLVDWDGQTWVLDNRHPLPMEYDLLPYKWHLLQVAGTQNWEHA